MKSSLLLTQSAVQGPVCNETFNFLRNQDSKFSIQICFPKNIHYMKHRLRKRTQMDQFSACLTSEWTRAQSFALEGKRACFRLFFGRSRETDLLNEEPGTHLQRRQSMDSLRGFYFSSACSFAHSTQLPLNNSYLYTVFAPIPDSSSLRFIHISQQEPINCGNLLADLTVRGKCPKLMVERRFTRYIYI